MELDINTLRSVMTVLAFIVFAGIWAWAWSSHRRQEFSEAAQAPFQWEAHLDAPACPFCPTPPPGAWAARASSGGD